tara:strand:- start:8857 stop:12120 length:3264 start_codon:yes stop_codon:yes gene_type:complete
MKTKTTPITMLTSVLLKAFFILSLSLVSILNSYGQGEANIWYFGNNAGLDFSGGAPIAIPNAPLNTFEGSSIMCDAAGNLLFYTDGDTVHNSNHVAMSNGIGLMGDQSSTQVLIIQKPGSSSLYYIFTTDNNGQVDGLRYSEVDMTLNGGLGDVTANKNILLHTPTGEKLAAIKHCNNQDIWVVTHDVSSSVFRNFLVTSAGVNVTPVISTVGIAESSIGVGQLKASPDGKKLAAVYNGIDRHELYDFNANTGIITNPLLFPQITAHTNNYGVEFSPNGTKLYISTSYRGNIYQYDLLAGTTAAIISSRVMVTSNLSWIGGGLQLGPDNKIYFTKNTSNSVGVINNPNTLGLGCNYVENGVALVGGVCSWGLPTFASYIYKPAPALFSVSDLCLEGDFTVPTVNDVITSISWNFGDPTSGVNDTSSAINPSHTFTSAGTYNVTLVLNYACRNDTLTQSVTVARCNCINPPILSVSAQTNETCSDSSGTVTVSVNGGTGTLPFTYVWNNGDSTSTADSLTAGNYQVIVTDNGGCKDTLDFVITNSGTTGLFTDTQTACGSYLWIDGITYNTNNTTAQDTVFGGAANGCDSIVTLDLTINNIGTSTDIQTACDSYLWIDGITYTTNNTSAQDTVFGGAASGCDSITMLNLTINTSVTSTDTQNACNTFTWIDGITYTSNNMIAQDTIFGGAASGCDSIINLNLTINTSVTGTDTQNACNTFMWIDGYVYSASTNTPTFTVVGGSINGCDSIVTLNLTMTQSPNTGVDGAIAFCATDPASDLFTELGVGAEVGGTWLPVMLSSTGMFDPGVDAATSYTYSLTNSCGTSINTVIVTVNSCVAPVSLFTLSADSICEGDCINLIDQSTGATTWLWTINGGTPVSSTDQNPSNVCFDIQGTYSIAQKVTNSSGSSTTTLSIVVHTVPFIFVNPDVTINLGESANLTAVGSVGNYTWTPPTWLSCVTCTEPISTPEETITYTVSMVDANGCSASGTTTVIVDYENVIFVPNIFSPNGDGNNDLLFVRGVGVRSINFLIYNRWGEKVFQTNGLDEGWDGSFRGKPMNNGVFVYYLEATFLDGTRAEQKGDITLTR